MNYTTTLDRIDQLVDAEAWPDAECLIRRALNRFGPADGALQRRLAEVLLQVDAPQDAWVLLENHPDTDFEINLCRCLASYLADQSRIGRECLENILSEAGPDDAEALMELSQNLYFAHQFDAASRILRHLLNLEPSGRETLYDIQIGLALCEWILQSGCDRDHAKAALDLRPGDPLAMSLLGNALFEAGQCEEGLALLHRVGLSDLLNLQCEEGAKRLFRWRRRTGQGDDDLREWTRHMRAWEDRRQWGVQQTQWVETSRERLEQASFVVDDPENKRLVGFSCNRTLSQRPLVNIALDERRRLRALEECSYLGIPVHTDPVIVERWYNHVGDKVVIESEERFWEFVDSASAVE